MTLQKELEYMPHRIDNLINQIQAIRAKNNKNWMDLVRLAFKLDKKRAQKIFMKITENDRRINALNRKMSDE